MTALLTVARTATLGFTPDDSVLRFIRSRATHVDDAKTDDEIVVEAGAGDVDRIGVVEGCMMARVAVSRLAPADCSADGVAADGTAAGGTSAGSIATPGALSGGETTECSEAAGE